MSAPRSLTRRQFVLELSRYGGSAYAAMAALGLVSKASGKGPDLSGLKPLGEGGPKVLILGAGIAGLTAGYELGKLGIDFEILEPRQKAGGRCMTIRGGDVMEEITGHRQTCRFDEGLYYNPGPSRFPQWHVTVDYCRELGVEIEPFVNLNENAFYYNENVSGTLSQKRVRIREAKTDLRGYVAETLARTVDSGQLDSPLGAEDKEKLLEFLRYEGDLSLDLAYRGSSRRGYQVWPGAGTGEAVVGDPHGFADLLQSDVWKFFHRANEYQYFSQMYTPVGGMDKIAQALASKLGDRITYGAEVTEIRKTNPGARVVYNHRGESREMTGDYAICTIPPTILRRMQTDFGPMLRTAVNVVPFQNSAKAALQFKRRFWEEDDQIFGGLSWTNLPIGEVWYPSSGFLGKKGIMGGYYLFGPLSDQLSAQTPEERIEFALTHGAKLHPQYRDEFENGFAVNWSNIPHIEGCLAHFPQALAKTLYPHLTRPDGEIYIAASWASFLGGWQAGAFESARYAVNDIHARASA